MTEARPGPALARAEAIGQAAAAVGFDWPDLAGPLAKVREELAELEEVLAHEPAQTRQQRLHAELGDLLFSAVNVARHLGVDPEAALHAACERFSTRFDGVRQQLGATLATASLDDMDAAWEAVKRDEQP